MFIKNFSKNVIDHFYDELNKPDNVKKIQNDVLDPIIIYISNKLFPYFIIIIILFVIISLMSVLNFCILLKDLLKKKYVNINDEFD